MGYFGLVFTRPGVKNLIVEVKRPGALAWIERSAVQSIDAHCTVTPTLANPCQKVPTTCGKPASWKAAVTGAVEVLTRGLESSPMAGPPNRHIEETARRAHELLLLAKSATPGAGPAEGDTIT